MKGSWMRVVTGLACAGLFLVAGTNVAEARGAGDDASIVQQERATCWFGMFGSCGGSKFTGFKKKIRKGSWKHEKPVVTPPRQSVPELDPNAAGGAIALLLGGSLVLLERRRRATVSR